MASLWFFLLYFQDDLIEKEKASYAISGGCCALAAIHLMGKLYVANAGDSRWVKRQTRIDHRVNHPENDENYVNI